MHFLHFNWDSHTCSSSPKRAILTPFFLSVFLPHPQGWEMVEPWYVLFLPFPSGYNVTLNKQSAYFCLLNCQTFLTDKWYFRARSSQRLWIFLFLLFCGHTSQARRSRSQCMVNFSMFDMRIVTKGFGHCPLIHMNRKSFEVGGTSLHYKGFYGNIYIHTLHTDLENGNCRG